MARTRSVTMQPVAELAHLDQLWNRCRPHGWRVSLYRCNTTATGKDDRFILAVYPKANPRAAIEVTTTNIESAATLILNRHKKALPGA